MSQNRFRDTVQSDLNYVGAFGNDDTVKSLNIHILSMADDIISSSCLAAGSEGTHVRYICAAKMMIKNDGVFSLF